MVITLSRWAIIIFEAVNACHVVWYLLSVHKRIFSIVKRLILRDIVTILLVRVVVILLGPYLLMLLNLNLISLINLPISYRWREFKITTNCRLKSLRNSWTILLDSSSNSLLVRVLILLLILVLRVMMAFICRRSWTSIDWSSFMVKIMVAHELLSTIRCSILINRQLRIDGRCIL